jgi:hypothetical protein
VTPCSIPWELVHEDARKAGCYCGLWYRPCYTPLWLLYSLCSDSHPLPLQTLRDFERPCKEWHARGFPVGANKSGLRSAFDVLCGHAVTVQSVADAFGGELAEVQLCSCM